MTRTYRVTVAGRFDRLPAPVRAELAAEAPEHDYTRSAFTEEGTFIYADALTRFTLRYLVTSDEPSAVEADEAAVVEAQVRAEEYLAGRGIPVKTLETSFDCLEDVKPRRR